MKKASRNQGSLAICSISAKFEYVLSGYILLHFSDDTSTKGYRLYHFFLHRRCAFIKQHSEKTCRNDNALLVARVNKSK